MFNVYKHDADTYNNLSMQRTMKLEKIRDKKHKTINEEMCLKYKHRIGKFISNMMHNPLSIDDQYCDRQQRELTTSNSQKYLDNSLSIGSPERNGTLDSVALNSLLSKGGKESPTTKRTHNRRESVT